MEVTEHPVARVETAGAASNPQFTTMKFGA